MANAPFPPSSLPQFFCLLRVDCCFDTSASPPLHLSASPPPLLSSCHRQPPRSSLRCLHRLCRLCRTLSSTPPSRGASTGALAPAPAPVHRPLHPTVFIAIKASAAHAASVAVVPLLLQRSPPMATLWSSLSSSSMSPSRGASTGAHLPVLPLARHQWGGGAIEDVEGNVWV
jgi:hypothetical protein